MTENSSLFICYDWRFISIRQYGHVWALYISGIYYRLKHFSATYNFTPNPLSRHSNFSPLKLTILTEAYYWGLHNFKQAPKIQIFGGESHYQGLPTEFGTKR